ncbi:DUF6884 domain-containing protein [Vulcanisaeta souniana]|uniref:DUF6884 domain-containing protein n=1 Tax=Vulcanisaeta souniana JCM 11219 TaxID=1293586 RepID=A0A830E3Q0_9CREN|nr:DUF6884 domain-containing protein [Vulcanisaeta souniana]BDR92975.1 hypothetical protein Vsou_20680 [Vulcanisaeta souniana JCM 11219]GGI83831.1 hypothetical protein GCM10007112_20830 [Vulcanisaeta souniana JCM 11219]
MGRRVAVIINCSRRKSVNDEQVVKRLGGMPGFDLEREDEYRKLLSDLMRPALDMYDGPEFRVLRRFRGCADVFVFSARYGVISGDRWIIPYDAYLGNADESVLDKWMAYGNPDLNQLVSGRWDYVIIRLTKTYMRYFRKLVDPCKLGDDLHIITSRGNAFNCGNAVYHHIRGFGDSQSVLRKLLMEKCSFHP